MIFHAYFSLFLFASFYIIFSFGPHIKTMKAYIYDDKPYAYPLLINSLLTLPL